MILEELLEIKGIDEPADGGKRYLGSWVFPDDNIYSDKAQQAGEPNTKMEEELFKYLGRHIKGNRPLPIRVAKQLRRIAESGIYPEVFRMAEKGKIYRGMALPMEFVEENFGGLPKKPKWYKAPIKWFLGQAQKEVSYDFSTKTDPRRKKWLKDRTWVEHAKSKASSWTSSFSAAKDFATGRAMPGMVSIVLVSDLSTNTAYAVDMNPLYKFFGFTQNFKKEKEVVVLGDAFVHEIIWLFRESA